MRSASEKSKLSAAEYRKRPYAYFFTPIAAASLISKIPIHLPPLPAVFRCGTEERGRGGQRQEYATR